MRVITVNSDFMDPRGLDLRFILGRVASPSRAAYMSRVAVVLAAAVVIIVDRIPLPPFDVCGKFTQVRWQRGLAADKRP